MAVEEVVEIVSLSEIKEKVVLVVKEAQTAVVLQEEEAAMLAEDQTDQTDPTELAEVLAIEVQAVSEEDVETNAYKINYLKTHLVSSAFFLLFTLNKCLKKSTFASPYYNTLNATAS